MKRTDIAMIIFIASVSMFIAYFVAGAVLGGSKNNAVTIKAADPISQTVEKPDAQVFRDGAINPTVEVYIGEGQNGS